MSEVIAEFFSRSFGSMAGPPGAMGSWKNGGKKKKGDEEQRFDLASIRGSSRRALARLPEANGSTLRGNGQMVWKLLDSTSSRIRISFCIFPHDRFPARVRAGGSAEGKSERGRFTFASIRQWALLGAKCNLHGVREEGTRAFARCLGEFRFPIVSS